MNQVAWRLHLENVELRKQARAQAKRKRLPRCIYCGTPTTRRSGACPAHADLPALDPGYTFKPRG